MDTIYAIIEENKKLKRMLKQRDNYILSLEDHIRDLENQLSVEKVTEAQKDDIYKDITYDIPDEYNKEFVMNFIDDLKKKNPSINQFILTVCHRFPGIVVSNNHKVNTVDKEKIEKDRQELLNSLCDVMGIKVRDKSQKEE